METQQGQLGKVCLSLICLDGQYLKLLDGSVFTHSEGDNQGKLRLVLRPSPHQS